VTKLKCPPFSRKMIFVDDPHLAAQLSSILAQPRTYLAVVDGPRLARTDRDAEIIRRVNAAARVAPENIYLAGLSDESAGVMEKQFPPSRVSRVLKVEDCLRSAVSAEKREALVWGRDHIGVGTLKAMYERRQIVFHDAPSPLETVSSRSGHLVVCEAGEDLSEVIAANYAYSLGAGLAVIPPVDEQEATDILESFYGLYDQSDVSPSQQLESLKGRLRGLCGELELPSGGSLTFISRHLPYGFAFSELPATHLFAYPDLGIAVINGFAAEQPAARGTNVAILVDPETTPAPEIDDTAELLLSRRKLVRRYKGPDANVRDVSQMVELYPYDLLIFATHCGDAGGYRWTYEYPDSEDNERKLVVDIALGFGRPDEDDRMEVTKFTRFHSLDGVPWMDPTKWPDFYVGSAIIDYLALTKGTDGLEPIHKENIKRVIGSAALKMADHNYLAMPQNLADQNTPVIVNNACVSWHDLAGRFMFCGARAYIGTLIEIGTTEAHDIVTGVFGKHIDKSFPHAVWASQNGVYGDGIRRPYVVTGVYPQKVRRSDKDSVHHVLRRLRAAAADWRKRLEALPDPESDHAHRLRRMVDYHEREFAGIRAQWLARRQTGKGNLSAKAP